MDPLDKVKHDLTEVITRQEMLHSAFHEHRKESTRLNELNDDRHREIHDMVNEKHHLLQTHIVQRHDYLLALINDKYNILVDKLSLVTQTIKENSVKLALAGTGLFAVLQIVLSKFFL